MLLAVAGFAAEPTVEIIGKTGIVSTASPVSGSTAGTAIQAARTGKDFHIIVKGLPEDKTVELELGFATLSDAAAGANVFDLSVNERAALTSFDIVKEAGGSKTGIVKKFTITPPSGFLDFHFNAKKGDAQVNYIRITGDDVSKLIAAPSHNTYTPEDEYSVPADRQGSFDVESGTVEITRDVQTWNSGVPLGGIGTGKFEILPNGQFANFTINNSWDLPVLRPQGTFLAVAVKASSGSGSARILHVNPSDPGEKEHFKDYTTVDRTVFRGEFPVARWDMIDDKLPLNIKVESWSPLVPHDVDNSSLPGAVISVTLENTKNYPVSTAVAFSWEDLNGRGGSLIPNDQYGNIGKGVHQDAATSAVKGFQITPGNAVTGRASTFVGDYFIGTPIKGAVVTRKLSWNPRTGSIPWWKQFRDKVRLDKIPDSPARIEGKDQSGPMASTLCVSFNLAPKEVRRVPFIVSWYFPNIVTLDSTATSPSKEEPDYADHFGSSMGVASHIAMNRPELREETDEWFNMIKRSTLPQWLKTHTLNSLFPLHSNTIYLKADRFAMLEAPAEMKGMLGPVDFRLSTGDFLRSMFPDLEKTELNLYARAQEESGHIPRYVGNIHGALAGLDPELLGSDWADPTSAWLLQVAAYWRETDDRAFVDSLRPAITKTRDYLKANLGEISDQTNAFTVTDEYAGAGDMAYLKAVAGLRAASELLQESDPEIDSLVDQARARLNASRSSSTFAAMLPGEFGIRQAGLPGIFDDQAVTDYLTTIYQNHYGKSSPVPLMQADATGNAVGTQHSLPGLLQSYAGALGLSLGMERGLDPYLRMFQVAYAAQKAPWKEALRYDAPVAAHASVRYHRSSMAAWTILRALSGVVHDRPNGRLYINPQPLTNGDDDMEIPVFTPGFWGWLKYNEAHSTGTLAITRMNTETTLTLTSIASGLGADGAPKNLVNLAEPFEIVTGASLEFTGWPDAAGTIVPQLPKLPEPEDLETTASLQLDADTTTGTEETSPSLSTPETAEGEFISQDDARNPESTENNSSDNADEN